VETQGGIALTAAGELNETFKDFKSNLEDWYGTFRPPDEDLANDTAVSLAGNPGLSREDVIQSLMRWILAAEAHIKALDPHDHPVTTHTHTDALDSFYTPLLGNDDFDITSFQLTPSRESLASVVETWRELSQQSGVPWVIGIAEPQTIENDRTDDVQGYPHGRRNKMWPVYMSGGGGFAWYVQEDGGGHTFDQRIDDFHEMDVALDWTGYALIFMDMLPVQDMTPNRSLVNSVGGGITYAMASTGGIYAVYNDVQGGPYDVDLTAESGNFVVKWFDPRNGGGLQNGSITNVSGGSWVSTGEAPNNLTNDWAALVVRTDIDMDGDQMRDIWEIEFIGGTKFSSGMPGEDWDGDGASDIDEHDAGTNPADSNSVLRIRQLMPDPPDTFVVHWSSETSRKYTILRRTNVLDTWVVHGSNLLATPPMNVHTVQPTSLNGYYRVRVD